MHLRPGQDRRDHGDVAQARIRRRTTTTWCTGVPATSATVTTLPGDPGVAINGTTPDRSISSVTS